LTVLTTVTLANSNSALPDDGDYTSLNKLPNKKQCRLGFDDMYPRIILPTVTSHQISANFY